MFGQIQSGGSHTSTKRVATRISAMDAGFLFLRIFESSDIFLGERAEANSRQAPCNLAPIWHQNPALKWVFSRMARCWVQWNHNGLALPCWAHNPKVGGSKSTPRNQTSRLVSMALLRQVKGVGPITALAYVLTLENPQRFGKSRDVGPYFATTTKVSKTEIMVYLKGSFDYCDGVYSGFTKHAI